MCSFLCHLDVMDSVCGAWLSFGQDFLVNIFCPGIGGEEWEGGILVE